ncbi:MAG: response regulator [candidate division Zixibacteria bacterium]|nr:response regulator [candidate division Zixibacteria bacterium]
MVRSNSVPVWLFELHRTSIDCAQGERALASKPGHILIVDDELVIRSLLSEMLSEEGFTVATASDGQSGLEMMNDGQVDLVISDVHMPVMDGSKLVTELRKLNPDLPVIVMNSIPDRDITTPADDRAIATVNKPFDLHELRSTIRRLRNRPRINPVHRTKSALGRPRDAARDAL